MQIINTSNVQDAYPTKIEGTDPSRFFIVSDRYVCSMLRLHGLSLYTDHTFDEFCTLVRSAIDVYQANPSIPMGHDFHADLTIQAVMTAIAVGGQQEQARRHLRQVGMNETLVKRYKKYTHQLSHFAMPCTDFLAAVGWLEVHHPKMMTTRLKAVRAAALANTQVALTPDEVDDDWPAP